MSTLLTVFVASLFQFENGFYQQRNMDWINAVNIAICF